MPGQSTATQLSVLLVEDNPGDALLLIESLHDVAGRQFAIEHVTTLAEAAAQGDRADVVLLDLGLPDSLGLATLQSLRTAGCTAPVVVITGNDDDETARAALQAGAQDYVVKGTVDAAVLARVIRHATERHQLQEVLAGHLRQRNHLSELARTALEGATAHELMEAAAAGVAAALEVDAAAVVTVDDDRVVVRARVGGAPLRDLGSDVPGGGGPVVREVLATGLPVVVADGSGGADLADAWWSTGRAASAAAVPIPGDDGQPLGVLLASAVTEHDFGVADLGYLSDVAMALSEASRRDATEHARRERVKELSALFEVQRSMQHDVPLGEQLAGVAALIAQGMQHPDDTIVRITVDGFDPVTDGRQVVESIRRPIGPRAAPRGLLEVGHVRPLGFLAEEHRFVAGIAEIIDAQVQRRQAMEAVRDSEQRLQSLVSSLPGIAFTTDRELRFLTLEGGAVEDLREALDAVVGQDVPTVLADAPELPEALAAYGAALQGETARFQTEWGDRTWQMVLEPKEGPGGEVLGVVGLALDVTEAQEAAAALEESRRRLQGLFDNANDAMALMDDDGRYVEVNPAAVRLLGRSSDELADVRLGQLAAQDAPVDVAEFWHQLRRDGTVHCELPVALPDGGTVLVDYRVVADIVPGLHLVVARDVTERRAAEDALRLSEERFRALVLQATDAIMITDESLRSTYVSPAMSRIVGRPVDQLMGTSAFDHLHPDDVEVIGEALRGVLGEGAPTKPVRVRVNHRDGSWRIVEAVGTDLRSDPAVGGIVVNVRDVTEQARAAEALAESEARFRRIAENARDVIFRVRLRPEPRYEYVSPAMASIVGYEPEELYARPELLFGIAHPDDREQLEAIESDPGLLARPMVLRWLHRDGSTVWIELRGAVVDDEAGLVIEGVARDVTRRQQVEEALVDALERERRAADELRQVGQMKHRFLQAVSHEMRTPLTSIIGFAELLEARGDQLPGPGRAQLTGRLADNARRLHQLLGDLLDLDRVTRDTADLRRQPVRMDQLVIDVAEQVVTGDRALTLDLAPLVIDVDVARVERIVENLLHNAARHTPPDARIWVSLQRVPDGVLLCVDDSGDGVPDAHKQAVFEAFAQGDTPAALTGGAGIGLSIVTEFAGLHGGRAWVEDRDGGGASFRVQLPCSVTEATSTSS